MLNLHTLLGRVRHLLSPVREGEAVCPGGEWDPLSHPALQRMSLEQLADLPIEPEPLRSGPGAAGSRTYCPKIRAA